MTNSTDTIHCEEKLNSDLTDLNFITDESVINWLVGLERGVTGIRFNNSSTEIWITTDEDPHDPNALFIRYAL